MGKRLQSGSREPNPRGCFTGCLPFSAEISFTSSSIVQGISDHYGVILEVEWEQCGCEPQVESVVPMYNKTDVLGLQTFLRDKFAVWASNGSCVRRYGIISKI